MKVSDAIVKVTSPSFSVNLDLTKALLEAFPNAVLNEAGERFKGQTLRNYLADADAAIIGLEPIDAELLIACPRLKFIGKYGVGLDNIDQTACQHHGVQIGWRGGVNKRSVAEQALCFMLGLARNVFFSHHQLREGEWKKAGGFQLSGKTVGIIGVGNTGKEVAKVLQPFACRILANDINDQSQYYQEHGLIDASKEQIFAEADFVTLHVPLTKSTHHLINSSVLAEMKSSAYLLNISRGDVVDQAALKEALIAGQIAGAAIDVFESEPPTDLEFLQLPNLVCTPHIGGNAKEGVFAMGSSAIEYLKQFYCLVE